LRYEKKRERDGQLITNHIYIHQRKKNEN